jgi:hypothetical protein
VADVASDSWSQNPRVATPDFKRFLKLPPYQGCRMVFLHTKYPILLYFGGPYNENYWDFHVHLEHFTAMCIFYNHLVYFSALQM